MNHGKAWAWIAVAGFVALAAAPSAGALPLPGPTDVERTVQNLLTQLGPTLTTVRAPVCNNVGGLYAWKIGCKDPWCHPSQAIGVYCIEKDKLFTPSGGFCEVYQPHVERDVAVPFVTGVGPVPVHHCTDTLDQTSFVGGFCNQAVEAGCWWVRGSSGAPEIDWCIVWSNLVGCVAFVGVTG